MHTLDCGKNIPHDPGITSHLNTFFLRFFKLPDFTYMRIRTFVRSEATDATRRETTIRIFSELAAPGRTDSFSNGIGMSQRNVNYDFVLAHNVIVIRLSILFLLPPILREG